ncbi:DUF7940 domain-containing protein [Acinetobacter chinensis]|jgi:F0F1-type ATP synthase assembly protein I|uniref:DUF7940 domain-containing protein n=1 Tax=Acinetobacter chinensis TaxID=2004650 RepID=UPI0029341BB1|nr:hypothetical protein [Acinetobacter chinensis]WOE42914.1 hypothetical protein QSG87_07285 [Acinetobacter chinensis]
MSSKVKNNLAILSYHEKRIQLEHEVQQRYENLSEEAQAIVRDVIREFISRSAMLVRIIYAQKFVEELENRLFEKNQAFQKLSEIHERTLTEHNDRLDCVWEESYTTGMQDTNKRYEAKFKELLRDKEILRSQIKALQDADGESEKIQQLRLQLSTRESELDSKTLELSEAKQKLSDQAKRHQQRVDELKAEIAQKPEPMMAELVSTLNTGLVVGNWRDSWKWISNWCFGLIVFFASTPIPPELLAVLPEHIRLYVIAWIAFCGFVGRYLNQSKPVPLPPVDAGGVDV